MKRIGISTGGRKSQSVHRNTFRIAIAVLLLGVGAVAWMTTGLDRTAWTLDREPSVSVAATITLSDLLVMSDDELSRVDLGLMNLLCANGLRGGTQLSVDSAIQELNRMAERVKSETIRHHRRFELQPGEFCNSKAYYRLLCLVTVLQQDFGVNYSPARARPSEGVIEPNETFFADARDIFLPGLLDAPRTGTCASLPVLYVAVGRRLGYPLKLVTAKNHLFVRWDGLGERLNIEATTTGMTTFEDEYYRRWPFAMSPEEEVEERYLKSLNAREELAVFLSLRTHCLLALGRRSQAVANQRKVCELVSYSAVQRQFLKQLENQHGREMAVAR